MPRRKDPKNDVDITLDTSAYEDKHGKRPQGHGTWVFIIKSPGKKNVRHVVEKENYWPATHTHARKKVIELGYKTATVVVSPDSSVRPRGKGARPATADSLDTSEFEQVHGYYPSGRGDWNFRIEAEGKEPFEFAVQNDKFWKAQHYAHRQATIRGCEGARVVVLPEHKILSRRGGATSDAPDAKFKRVHGGLYTAELDGKKYHVKKVRPKGGMPYWGAFVLGKNDAESELGKAPRRDQAVSMAVSHSKGEAFDADLMPAPPPRRERVKRAPVPKKSKRRSGSTRRRGRKETTETPGAVESDDPLQMTIDDVPAAEEPVPAESAPAAEPPVAADAETPPTSPQETENVTPAETSDDVTVPAPVEENAAPVAAADGGPPYDTSWQLYRPGKKTAGKLSRLHQTEEPYDGSRPVKTLCNLDTPTVVYSVNPLDSRSEEEREALRCTACKQAAAARYGETAEVPAAAA